MEHLRIEIDPFCMVTSKKVAGRKVAIAPDMRPELVDSHFLGLLPRGHLSEPDCINSVKKDAWHKKEHDISLFLQ